jgi:Ca2+-binding RTX toxin-like protein
MLPGEKVAVSILSHRPRPVAITAIGGVLVSALVLAADIVGTPGPDFLEGTPQEDTLDGKGGADTMMGLGSDDVYTVNQVDDEVIEGAGEGNDTIRSVVSFSLPIFVENLVLTGVAAANGTGNNLANRLTGNGANNLLNGGIGNDTMIGKGGNDVYIVNASGDIVTEGVGQGTDTVRSTVSYTLRPNVEKLVLTGAAAINGTGNILNNFLTGNAAANVLNGRDGRDNLKGGSGDDRLAGNEGNDTLLGGPGLDTFVIDTPLDGSTNVDRITDFNPAQDVFRLVGEVFPTLNTAGTLPANAFRAATVAASGSHRILYDPATGFVKYDADGTGATAPVRFATLDAGLAVSNADFVVVDPVAPPAVDYMTQIQPIFTDRCVECHSGGGAPEGLRLDAANSYNNLVNVNSREVPTLKRVKPSEPNNSYLVHKIEGNAAVGGQMPLGQAPLSTTQINLIREWISAGAER